jgi:hypothetical protein
LLFLEKYLSFFRKQTGSPASALDGNLAANKQALTHTWTLSIPPGNSFWLRWSKQNVDVGTSHGLSIDDLTVTVTYSTGNLLNNKIIINFLKFPLLPDFWLTNLPLVLVIPFPKTFQLSLPLMTNLSSLTYTTDLPTSLVKLNHLSN